jgi:D-serine deaminase-like pyridoxal phosphate-dependent protein
MQNFRELPTPCLVLNLDAFEANLERMSRFAADRRIALRPHAKTHKCVQVARRQVARGAIGICVATIAEAEVMAGAGLRGLLITAEMVGEPKIRRLLEVVGEAPDTMVVVDDERNVAELQQATKRAGATLQVLIDLDVGQNRTGIATGLPAQSLAAAIGGSSHIELVGICAYAGHLAHLAGFEARQKACREAWSRALETAALLRKDGHDIRIITGASTGSYNIDSEIHGVTELQAGSYVFMDVEYLGIHKDFAPALCVLATVIHRSGNKAIVDAGLKAFATDRGFGPSCFDIPDLGYEFAGDEHGRLLLPADRGSVNLGDKLRFIPPHCDPNVNLYGRIYCVRGEEVVDEWSIMNRGSGYF